MQGTIQAGADFRADETAVMEHARRLKGEAHSSKERETRGAGGIASTP
jgi:hypothetical protein